MGNTSTIDRPVIEDTLFGESKVTEVQAGSDPDGPDGCFCICGCMTRDVKIANRMISSANSAVGI